MSPPSWASRLPHPTPLVVTEYHLELPVLYSNFPLAIYFTHVNVYVSMQVSQFAPPSISPTVSKVYSLCLYLYSCPANRFISTISLDSILLFIVQLLSHVQLFATPWTAAHQDPLSITNSQFAQTHVHCVGDAIQSSYPLSPPSPLALNLSQHRGLFQWPWIFSSGGQSIGASTSVLPMNIQGWFPSGLTSLISLLSKGLSRVCSRTTVQRYRFFGTQPSLTSMHDYWKNHSCDYMDLCQQSDVSAF